MIMGEGWNQNVKKIRKLGFDVSYYENFDRDKYLKIMPSLEHRLYYGFDDGAMGFWMLWQQE